MCVCVCVCVCVYLSVCVSVWNIYNKSLLNCANESKLDLIYSFASCEIDCEYHCYRFIRKTVAQIRYLRKEF